MDICRCYYHCHRSLSLCFRFVFRRCQRYGAVCLSLLFMLFLPFSLSLSVSFTYFARDMNFESIFLVAHFAGYFTAVVTVIWAFRYSYKNVIDFKWSLNSELKFQRLIFLLRRRSCYSKHVDWHDNIPSLSYFLVLWFGVVCECGCWSAVHTDNIRRLHT